MSQPPTANMGLVLPTDHGSADIWDTIFDTSYQLIDAHDHTTGKGVKIPASALNLNADVSWSSGGTSHAITDLVAIDFAAVASSAVTALAGALWLNSADSNLYWRTPGGTNVQLTAGAALNVAAFTGGIGGDYAAIGALVVFDDATDSYWFQQQVGASVRQYARMRNADVDLYEYKANPAAGVPTNRVRLASPAALAASYALTMPPALPASGVRQPLRVTDTGLLYSTGESPVYHAGLAIGNGFIASYNLVAVSWPATSGTIVLPLRVYPGDSLATWTIWATKTSTSANSLTAQLREFNPVTGISAVIGTPVVNSTNSPGLIIFSGTGGITVAFDRVYSLEVVASANNSDAILGYRTVM